MVMSVLIIAIWIIIEVKRLKHKVFAIALIAMIIFGYLSFGLVLKDQDVDLKTVPGTIKATKLYFSWMGSLFGNMKSITSHAVKMDWNNNVTIDDDEEIFDLNKYVK